MSAKLLPCPFCGGPVELEKTVDRRDWWGVVCRNTWGRGGTCAIEQRPSASEAAAVERWNTRALVPTDRTPNSTDPRDEAHAAGWNACLATIRSAESGMTNRTAVLEDAIQAIIPLHNATESPIKQKAYRSAINAVDALKSDISGR